MKPLGRCDISRISLFLGVEYPKIPLMIVCCNGCYPSLSVFGDTLKPTGVG
jgi:hypothetical protein